MATKDSFSALPAIFTVKLADYDSFKKFISGSPSKELKARIDPLTKKYGGAVAELAVKRFADVLSPEHIFNVGASGKSAKNFEVRSEQRFPYWRAEVYEGRSGGDGPANVFIRRGFRLPRAERKIPIEKIRLWMAYKNITITTPEGEKKRAGKGRWYSGLDKKPDVKYILSKSRTKKGGSKPYGRAQNKAWGDPVLFAILAKLEANGSRRTHWVGLYPKGQGKFDYITYVVRQNRKSFDRLLFSFGETAMVAIIDYFGTFGGGSANIGGGFRLR